MALVLADRVKETTTTTGTGPLSLLGASTNFKAFGDVLSDGDTTYYALVDSTNNTFETGLGTYATSGNTLTRTTILSSSNSDSVVNLGSGTKDVFITYTAAKAIYEDASGNPVFSGVVPDANISASSVTQHTSSLYEPLIAEVNRQTFYRQASQPTGGTYREGDQWYETDTETLYFYREVSTNVFSWVPLSTATNNSDTLDGGSY